MVFLLPLELPNCEPSEVYGGAVLVVASPPLVLLWVVMFFVVRLLMIISVNSDAVIQYM